jgi:hypothetical protein
MPLIVPVLGAIDRPLGSPVADQVRALAPVHESLAVIARAAMAGPEKSDWLPGLATETVLDWGLELELELKLGAGPGPLLVIVQVKLAEPVTPRLSVAVKVTG